MSNIYAAIGIQQFTDLMSSQPKDKLNAQLYLQAPF